MNCDLKLDINDELIEDFKDSFNTAYAEIQEILVSLEQAEDKTEDLHALFRQLHSIKGNCRMLQLNTMSNFIHNLENILDDIRSTQLAYDTRFGDLLLLSLDQCNEAFSGEFYPDCETGFNVDTLVSVLNDIHTDHANYDKHMRSALEILEPNLLDNNDRHINETNTDTEFFRNVAQFLESRLGYEHGMTERLLDMAEQLNALAGHPVDVNQLRLAVYAHDMGMAFLDQEMLNKDGRLTEQERNKLATHPELGADLLTRLGHWNEASRIVSQHHEHYDGNGYPHGLAADDICAGAKILAIVDTYEAMTHKRAHREHKRTDLRVIAEINAKSGNQFDPYWVEIFNQWMRQILVNKRKS